MTVISSSLLSDSRPVQARPARTVDPDFAATVAAGFVEPLDDWAARTRRPRDWQQRLAFAACLAHVVLAARVQQLENAVKAVR